KSLQGKDGDVIDCVDIYQQPAFDHPLLKNHTIQMESSSIPNIINGELYNTELSQSWHENGECPEGTIPIRRSRNDEHYAPHNTTPSVTADPNDDASSKESAVVYMNDGHYYGVHAALNVWAPALNDADYSVSQLWIFSGTSAEQNVIEAGWKVNYASKEPQLTIYWTSDGYSSTGCSNLNCPGFVQTSRKFALGASIRPVSSYMGNQFYIEITVYKNFTNWNLRVQNEELGYWPGTLFTNLAVSAEKVALGGEVSSSMPKDGHHTSAQMGSGHFPSEGIGKASFIRNLQYMDGDGKFNDAIEGLTTHATKPSCYDVILENNKNGVYGTHLYFGGPGYSATCP
ncbi:protein neprosin-like, partial [Corylus avellana]|uniref:protein neprosin-like n=1 Tax=Corylus avellana TaxID=13451 RepID=UPI00286B64E2